MTEKERINANVRKIKKRPNTNERKKYTSTDERLTCLYGLSTRCYLFKTETYL